MHATESAVTRFEVLQVASAGSGALVVSGRLLAGEVKEDMVLAASGATGRWRISGSAFIPAEAWAQGMRGLSLIPLESGEGPKVGQVLLGYSDERSREAVPLKDS
jgi:hypothetical protein